MSVDIYQDIEDTTIAGDIDALAIEKEIILPLLFLGRFWDMVWHFNDTMTICVTVKNSDFIITFTYNLNWVESKSKLTRILRQNVENRPDTIIRVFKIRRKNDGCFENKSSIWKSTCM